MLHAVLSNLFNRLKNILLDIESWENYDFNVIISIKNCYTRCEMKKINGLVNNKITFFASNFFIVNETFYYYVLLLF